MLDEAVVKPGVCPGRRLLNKLLLSVPEECVLRRNEELMKNINKYGGWAPLGPSERANKVVKLGKAVAGMSLQIQFTFPI